MEPSPVYSSTRHVYIDMDPKSRRRELNELVEVPCINKNNYGVDRTYIKAAFKALLGRKTNEYGVRHGVMREVKDIFVLWRETGAINVPTKVRVAFAVVCREGKMFHRLRSEFVGESVFLALLCGENATVLMDEILRVYEDKWVTLDALPHVIGYYLRPAFGEGLMIDTRSSFASSAEFRATYREFDTETGTKADTDREKKERGAATSKITAAMKTQIPLGEEFVPRAESSSRREGSVLDETYGVAHIVYPPAHLPRENRSFERVCYATSNETAHRGFLDREYWAPIADEGRVTRQRGAEPLVLVADAGSTPAKRIRRVKRIKRIKLTDKCTASFAGWRSRDEGFRVERYGRIEGRTLDELTDGRVKVKKTRSAARAGTYTAYTARDLAFDVKSGLVTVG